MFGSVFVSFPPLRTEKPPAILHFLSVFSSFSPIFCALSGSCFSPPAHSRIADGELPNTMPMLAFAHSKRGRQFPSGASFHVKLFLRLRESKCTLPSIEKAQGKGHECPPSFRELPRSVAICEPYYFSFPCDICVDCASCVLLRSSFYDTDRK